MSPFTSVKQEKYLFMNPKTRDMAKKWRDSYGDAKDWPWKNKNKKKKKIKKTAMINTLLKLSQNLDQKGFHKLADKLEIIISQLDEINAGCKECGQPIGVPSECPECGWKESLLCPSCSMKKMATNVCPDCGLNLNTAKTIESKVLTYKEKQASPCVFPKSDKRVTDNKDHFPIPDIIHGRSALQMSEKSDSHPWFDGTVEELRATVRHAVYKKYPGLKSRKEKKED